MNYQLLHDTLIARARNRLLESYTERHHIVPRCLGGTDDASNLVHLTGKEHFVVHHLLCRLYPGNSSLRHALWMMATTRPGIRITGRLYESLRTAFAVKMRHLHTGKSQTPGHIAKRKLFGHGIDPCTRGSAGRKWSEEAKRRLSEKFKGRPSSFKGRRHTPAAIEKQRQAKLGKTLTPEQKRKISEKNTGRRQTAYQKQRVAEVMAKSYVLVSPQGERYTVTNLRQFAALHQIPSYSNLYHVAAGRWLTHHGWTCSKA